MADSTDDHTRKARLTEVLDWAVFSLGVMSLSMAIATTVLTKTEILDQIAGVDVTQATEAG